MYVYVLYHTDLILLGKSAGLLSGNLPLVRNYCNLFVIISFRDSIKDFQVLQPQVFIFCVPLCGQDRNDKGDYAADEEDHEEGHYAGNNAAQLITSFLFAFAPSQASTRASAFSRVRLIL